MRILVISDTHVPRVAPDLPKEVYDAVSGVDMIVHAGDIVDEELLDRLKALKPVRAVCGNMDSQRLQKFLKQKEVFQAEKVRIGLIHGHGASSSLIDTVGGEFKNVDVIIFGHSHAAVNMEKGGVLYFNPGSPTDTVFAKTKSYGILDIDGDKVNAKVIEL
jgi:putative phosphoesterase